MLKMPAHPSWFDQIQWKLLGSEATSCEGITTGPALQETHIEEGIVACQHFLAYHEKVYDGGLTVKDDRSNRSIDQAI